jgi:hypothetical protein
MTYRQSTDYHQLFISDPVNRQSRRIISGGVAAEPDFEHEPEAFVPLPVQPSIIIGPMSRRRQLINRVRQLERQIKNAKTKADRKELGRMKFECQQALRVENAR